MAKSNTKKTVVDTSDKTPEEKQKALETAISQIEKNFGKGTIIKMGENPKMNVSSVSTGSISLDMALGIGGLPKGRIVEVYGPESSGKTTLTLHAIAEVQKTGGQAAFIDAEHALDPVYAKNLGVDIDNLLVSQPDSGEQALEICDALVRSGAEKAVGYYLQNQLHRNIHKPAQRKGRRSLRKSRNHNGRSCAEILRVGKNRDTQSRKP